MVAILMQGARKCDLTQQKKNCLVTIMLKLTERLRKNMPLLSKFERLNMVQYQ